MEKEKKVHGLSLRFLNRLMIIGSTFISIAIIIILLLLSSNYKKLNASITDYMELVDSATEVKSSSDYMTEQVRNYVISGNIYNLNNYIAESNSDVEDKALEKIGNYYDFHNSVYYNLSQAVSESKALMNKEYYALRLACDVYGVDYTLYTRLKDVELNEEDKLLTQEEKKEKAINLVFDAEYVFFKDDINHGVNGAISQIKLDVNRKITASSKSLNTIIILQRLLVAILVVFLFTLFVAIYFSIVKPLNKGANLINDGKELKVEGIKEYKFLSNAYNKMRKRDNDNKELLTYELEHDKLTTLYNRTGYDLVYHNLNLEATAFILMDIDDFKGINDKYGHAFGDKVLRKVGETLKENFRADDYICRIGGDEFAILLPNYGVDNTQVLIDKCKNVNKTLRTETDDIPSFTLSIGIAFGDEYDDTDTLFKKADSALYVVKNNGRNGISLFGDNTIER